MDKLVSVIVPVHNGGGYIGTCLESIRNQSYTNLEIIVVNDGSRDCTMQICLRHSQQDPRIRLINRKNGGVSAARNAGILAAKGEFICFVDSDDYLEAGFIECLCSNAFRHRVSISMCNYNFVVNGKKHPIPVAADKKKGKLNKKDFYRGLMEDTYRGFLWNKLFERRFLINSSGEYLLLNPELNICEDLLYVVNAARHGQSFYFDERCLYNYVQRNESAYNTSFHPGKLSEIDAYDAIMDIIGSEVPECQAQYEQAYLNMALKLKDSYSHAPEQLQNGNINRCIEQAVNRFYLSVMKSGDVSIRKKIFYSMYRRSPRLIREIKNIHHKVVYR